MARPRPFPSVVVAAAALVLGAAYPVDAHGATRPSGDPGAESAAAVAALAASDWDGAPARLRIDNFGEVGDGYYRGAQPEGGDYAALAALGVRTVIDLQADGDNEDEAAIVEGLGMRFVRIPMTQHAPPTPAEIERFLEIVGDPALQPVYVHCKGGRHRTGVMTAVYRMERDGWAPADAFQEMKSYHFGLEVLHREFTAFVREYAGPAAAARAIPAAAGREFRPTAVPVGG